jgi:hypothetical protein
MPIEELFAPAPVVRQNVVKLSAAQDQNVALVEFMHWPESFGVPRRDLAEHLRVTVFAPDDLELVKGGPATRRVYLDELLGMLAVRYDAARGDFERVLKQRNALLRAGIRDARDGRRQREWARG